jgi:hypothetical protein
MSNLALLERQLKDINEFSYDSKAIAVEIAGLALDDIAEKDLGMWSCIIVQEADHCIIETYVTGRFCDRSHIRPRKRRYTISAYSY